MRMQLKATNKHSTGKDFNRLHSIVLAKLVAGAHCVSEMLLLLSLMPAWKAPFRRRRRRRRRQHRPREKLQKPF